MRRFVSLGTAWLALGLGICASASRVSQAQDVRTIVVTLPGDVGAARSRVVAALVANGLVVAEAGGPVVRTTSYRFNPATFLVVTANLIQQDSTTTVVLSGTYSTPVLGIRDEPLTESRSHLKGDLWRLLATVADSVRQKPRS